MLAAGTGSIGGMAARVRMTDPFRNAPPYRLAARTGELSMHALTSAMQLGAASVATYARYLYRYNTAPASPSWRRTYPTRESVLDQLRTPVVPWAANEIERSWTLIDDADTSVRWWIWTHASCSIHPADFSGMATWKLYVSPTCDSVRDAFHAVVSMLADVDVLAVKVGRDLPGLLRPDKMIVYFARREHLEGAAARLRAALDHLPAQGVPFTAPLTDDGMLSWGIDPPYSLTGGEARSTESWRGWVTNRLARFLHEGGTTPDVTLPAWTFALSRLELEGVDPRTFVPKEGHWAGFRTG